MFRLVLSIVTSKCPTIEHRRVDHLEDNYEWCWHRNSKSKQCKMIDISCLSMYL